MVRLGWKRTSFSDEAEKSARQLMNALVLTQSDGILRHEFNSNPNRRGAGTNERGGRELVDTTGGNERNLGKRDLERTNILVASHGASGEDLYEIRAHLPRCDDFSRR